MENGLNIYSTLQYWWKYMVEAATQGANWPIGSNYELSVLLKDTAMQSWGSVDRIRDPLVTDQPLAMPPPLLLFDIWQQLMLLSAQ